MEKKLIFRSEYLVLTIFLFVDRRFDPFIMDGFLYFQPKRGNIPVDDGKTCDVTCFPTSGILL